MQSFGTYKVERGQFGTGDQDTGPNGIRVTFTLPESAAAELRAMPATTDGQSLSQAGDRSTVVRAMAGVLDAIRGA